MIAPGRYTSGRIAVANLEATIAGLERRRAAGASFRELATLSDLLLARGDLLGRIADHDRAERVAGEAVAQAPAPECAHFVRARIAARFHRFEEASSLLERARASGHPWRELDHEQAALLQATGLYETALALRVRLAEDAPGIGTLGALALLLAEMDEWTEAETCFAAALASDHEVSPLPCGELLFAWGVTAMRFGDLDRAEAALLDLQAILPLHVPGRGHRAEIALQRGQLELATILLTPLLEIADDPEYRATHAEILAARGDAEAAARDVALAATAYERLLERRPEGYCDHAAAFFLGIGNRPQRAVELATRNWQLRDTPRSRQLLARAILAACDPAAAPCGVPAPARKGVVWS